MKGMGGEAGEYSLKYYRAIRYMISHMFYEVYKIYLDHSKSVDRSVIIYRGGGGVEERFLEVTWFSGEPKGSVVAKRV